MIKTLVTVILFSHKKLYEKSYKLLDMLRNHVIIKHMASEDETICNDLESYNEFMLSFSEFLKNNKNEYTIEEFKKKNLTLDDINKNDIYCIEKVEELSYKYKIRTLILFNPIKILYLIP